jgi:hypothetical protein
MPGLTIAIAIFHGLSAIASVLLAVSQYRLNNILLFRFAAVALFLFHLFMLVFVAGFDAQWPDSFPLSICYLRKAIEVYLVQSVYFFSACICIRLWMLVTGREKKEKADKDTLESRMSLIALAVPLVPTLVAVVPQMVFGIRFSTSFPKLYTCYYGYLYPWQMLVVYPFFGLLPLLTCFVCLIAIVVKVVTVLSTQNLPAEHRSAMFALFGRVLLLSISVGLYGLYNVMMDIVRGTGHELPWNGAQGVNTVGHVMDSLWGLLFFLVFGTTMQSRNALLNKTPVSAK